MIKMNKRIYVAFIAAAVILIVAVALLIGYSNRILKSELKKSLGKDFSVERIVLRWGSVDAFGIKFKRGDEVVAHAEKINIRADFIGLLRKRHVLSRLSVEKPVLQLEIDKKGNILHPFVFKRDGDDKAASAGEPNRRGQKPFEINRIIIKQGAIYIKDNRLPAPDNISNITNLDIRFDNFSFPFRDAHSDYLISAVVEGSIVSGQIRAEGRVNLKTNDINLKFNGQKIVFFKSKNKEKTASIENVSFVAVSQPGSGKSFLIDNLLISKPFIRAEFDSKGKFINPVPGFTPSSSAKSVSGSKEQKSFQVTIKNIRITDGELLYLDGKVSRPPHLTRIDAINIDITGISIPFKDNYSDYNLNARIPGSIGAGSLRLSGKTNFKTMDTNAKVDLKNLDITGFKPYFQKRGDADVTKGILNLNMDATIRAKHINAPGRVVIRDLEFREGRGAGDKFIGVPRSMVLDLLKTENNEITLNFTLEGNINDPKFSITESILKKITITLAQKLGLSVIEIGERIVIEGAKGIKGIGEGLKDIGERLQKIFE